MYSSKRVACQGVDSSDFDSDSRKMGTVGDGGGGGSGISIADCTPAINHKCFPALLRLTGAAVAAVLNNGLRFASLSEKLQPRR